MICSLILTIIFSVDVYMIGAIPEKKLHRAGDVRKY